MSGFSPRAYTAPMISSKTRLLLATPLLALALATTSACSSENTDCNVVEGKCTVTFDRGVNAKAEVLGVNAEFVSATDTAATLKIGGQQITVPLEGEEASGEFNVRVQSITQEQVIVVISAN
ncbi:hypothetical protein GCM10010439_49060 [Actinocorallia aurantiaca]|jgi:hypothetical protein|uniref:Uncharacterized protein n=2 Tax=Actinocorallia aurantiaca TaxID=46204 RepID=A0ABP6GZT4_9ACTN